MNPRQPFLTHCFALVICRHTDGRYLCVKETRNRGWWIAGGLVEPKEDFCSAAIRETKEEAGVDIELKGILRIEHSICGHQTARMRVIFFATSSDNNTKQISDSESECACWFSIKEIENLAKSKPGHRGTEIIDWPKYIENGGQIAPLGFLVDENQPIKLIVENLNIANKVVKQSIQNIDDIHNQFIEALDSENFTMVKELLIKGANANKPINTKNWTALHWAIKIKNEQLVKILLISGADPELVTHKNRNCFHFAVQSNINIVKLLLIQISDKEIGKQLKIINFQDSFDDTPLHVAAKDIMNTKVRDMNIFNLMVNSGANPKIRNSEGYTPEDYLNLK